MADSTQTNTTYITGDYRKRLFEEWVPRYIRTMDLADPQRTEKLQIFYDANSNEVLSTLSLHTDMNMLRSRLNYFGINILPTDDGWRLNLTQPKLTKNLTSFRYHVMNMENTPRLPEPSPLLTPDEALNQGEAIAAAFNNQFGIERKEKQSFVEGEAQRAKTQHNQRRWQ